MRPYDKKIAVIGLTKVLANSEAFSTRYPKGWPHTCEALLRLLVDPPVMTSAASAASAVEMIDDSVDVDDAGFGVGFTPLNTCKKAVRDPYPEAADVKSWVGGYLKEADERHGGRVAGFVRDRLNTQQTRVLVKLMS